MSLCTIISKLFAWQTRGLFQIIGSRIICVDWWMQLIYIDPNEAALFLDSAGLFFSKQYILAFSKGRNPKNDWSKNYFICFL